MEAATERRVVDAHDLMGPEYGLSRPAAYAILNKVGVRISERRIVALRERVDAYLAGKAPE